EYCANGDLNHAMHAWRKLPNEHARFWIAQLLLALDELHENNIILRDVKPENILFNRHGHVVLADFGLARHFASTSTGELGDGDADFLPPGLFEQDDPDVNYTRRACGTAGFMAPEILENKPYSFSVDFWAMGIIMYTMLVGKMPFAAADRNNRAALDAAVVHDPLRFESWDHVDPMARDLLSKVLSKNPSERPSVEEMKAHAFFESIDWERLAAHKLRAPWIPAAHTVFSPTIGLLIPSGAPYTPTDDPCPQFSFVSPKLLGAPPVLPETVDEPEAPAKKMRRGAFRRLFSRGVKETWLRGGDLHKIGDVVFRMEGAVVITPSPLAPLIVSETPTTDASSEYVSEKGVRRQFGARVKGWWRSMLAKAKKA
ncbi:kinase-like protein, partial [Auriscalpium vulgare]